MEKLKYPKSYEYFLKVKKYLPAGAHYNFSMPNEKIDKIIPFYRGNGARIWDLDDNEYLDLFCKFGALIVGHNNVRYNAELKECIDTVLAVDQCHLEQEVCERLVELIPCAEQIRFGLSGTESIQNALRLSRAYTGKQKFVRFLGHYHGNADNIMGGIVENSNYPVPSPGKSGFFETEGRDPNVLQQQSFLIPWNDIEILENLLANHSQEIAAIIMEPIAVNGGGILPQPGYLEKVRKLCDRYHVVLIFDEVITGFRVSLQGAQGLFGVTPDLAIFGKSLAGGAVPVSAIAGKKEIMDLYTKMRVVHLGTFNGYPLGLAAVRATLKLLSEDPNCYQRMGNLNLKIAQVFVNAAKAADVPLVVQGVPNALVFHIRETPVTDYTSDVTGFQMDALFTTIAREYGIYFSPISRIYANLLLDDSDVNFFQERIGEVFVAYKPVMNLFHKPLK